MHADAVVYRAGQGGGDRRHRRRPDHDRGDPPRPQLGCQPDQARARPDVLLAHHLRGTRLRSRRVRPAVPAARTGAEPSLLHGDDELLHRVRGGGGGRRGRARAGRHRPHERPVPDRFASAGRGDGDAGVPRRRHPDRLLGDQGALDGHRGQGDLLHGHDRRLPGRRHLPGRQALLARASWSATSGEWRLRTHAWRRSSRATSTPRSSACAPGRPTSCGSCERYGLERFHESVERMYDHGEAVVRSYFEQIPDGRYVGRGEMDSDGITDDPIPFEVELEVDGSTCAARLLERTGRAARTGQLSARLDRFGRTRRHDDARGRRRGAERGALPADRGGHASRLDVPRAVALAVLPLRLAGNAGNRGGAQRSRGGRARTGHGLLGRRPRRPRLVRRSARARASSGATARRTPSARVPARTATAVRACCTSSRRRRASRRWRSGRRRTRG